MLSAKAAILRVAADLGRPDLRIKIPIPPVAASRPRVTRYGTYHVAKYANWLREANQHLLTPAHLKGPLIVAMTAAFQQPKASKLPHPNCDVDNVAKATLDAINHAGTIWDDDKQVAYLLAYRRWAAKTEQPHSLIEIWTIDEDTRG